MTMRIDTPIRIFGYPALAMLMMMLAGAGAAYLVVQIVRHDRGPHADPERAPPVVFADQVNRIGGPRPP